jgi:hypothetical protein
MPFYNKIKSRYNIVTSFHRKPISKNSKSALGFSAFALGYHNAAKLLSKSFLSKPGFYDFDGYPIVFLYRHSFELYLKNIIYRAAVLGAFKDIKNIDNKLYNTHSLSELSLPSIELLKILFPKDKYVKEISKTINSTAKEYDEIDPTSFSYRYPIDKKGKPSTKIHQVVNITSIALHMDKLLGDLDGLSFGLEMEIDSAAGVYEILQSFSD